MLNDSLAKSNILMKSQYHKFVKASSLVACMRTVQ
jgi:hypothetical protein